ncbi:MAG: undecaprenyl/decaprenyl-phosphate alpha-N-acetylglucosaminyl 1-phosphate transferase [Treponema sp.]|nr:undecaprenyl/decaprenyl-phosphate alpha-N-acetylglucosaminyl 1-phosphate transferase [Treponema sp.]
MDERKIHTGDIPRLGGLGFAPAFIIIAFFISFSTRPYLGLSFLPPLMSMILILVSGVLDDFRPVAPKYRLIIQIMAGLCVIIPGYTFSRLFFINIGGLSELTWIRYPLSLLWIVGLINAMNFIDGVDGLAGGIAVLIAITYACIFAHYSGNHSAALLCICLAAVIGGFLIFNAPVPKARIFMGDGGAYFLGAGLAILPLINKGSTRPALPLAYAAALLIIPLFDIISAIWRRIRDKRRIDSPDMSHIHHKLKNVGLNDREDDGVLYGLQIILCVLVFFSVKVQGFRSLVLLGSAYFTGIGFFAVIHFLNRRSLRTRTEIP